MTVDPYATPLQTRLEITKNEVQAWRNTAYAFGLRARIARETHDEEDAKRNQAEMEKAYKKIDSYMKIIAEIEAEIEAEKARVAS